MSSGLSRRGLLALLGRPFRTPAATARPVADVPRGKAIAATPATAPLDQVAVIQGRFCLAYTTSCSVCVERCPVMGAMKVSNGIPMVVPDVCTGCGVCHHVCPAPTNAVLVLPRRRIPRFSAAPSPATPP